MFFPGPDFRLGPVAAPLLRTQAPMPSGRALDKIPRPGPGCEPGFPHT